ncbi:hypothetical protein SDC9_43526 [bioreactor metagenome]|uniref:DUF1540 domain-containing protein n=1 Tax=bioreactor metagenome TaxID=1076179 RepID=A0A644W1E4_9ZZZZ|nr:DUF1540 domain-containing protein [Negativicutes bacterium]
MARDVVCSVRNCKFWEGHRCTADAIQVSVDGGGDEAGYIAKTNCHTFAKQL